METWRSGNYALSEGEDIQFVATAPVVLYSVIMANESDSAAAIAGIYNGAGTVCAMDISVPPGGTVVWTGCLAMPKGLSAVCEAGVVRVTVMYV